MHSEDADALSVSVEQMVEDEEEIVPGLECIHLRYGKSPGELALYWPERKLVLVGDLVVGAPLGRVSLLMDEKLADPPRAALELRKVEICLMLLELNLIDFSKLNLSRVYLGGGDESGG